MSDRIPPRILLIGMMGAGKTTVGRELATLTGRPYLDNDELVERATGVSAADVLATDDETTLRRVEEDALDIALAASPPLVASVAAGVVLSPRARQRMREHAYVVYLRASTPDLARRVRHSTARPWIDDDPEEALTRLSRGREELYLEVADLVVEVEGTSPHDLANQIISAATDHEPPTTPRAE